MDPVEHTTGASDQGRRAQRKRGRAHRRPAISRNGRHTDGRRHRSPGKESRRRSRPHYRQEDSSSGHAHCSARSRKPSKPAATLHSLPTLRVGMSQSGFKTIGQTGIFYATRDVVRARILPARMYQMFGGMPGRRHPSTDQRGEIGHKNRLRRCSQRKLHTAYRRRFVRELCPPLPHRRHTDD